jgi:cytochrome c oxidase assembly protein subunit 15
LALFLLCNMRLSGEKVSKVARFAWATLCFNVAVVLWGAFVRATGSGAGCGNKWPNCGGSVLGTSAKAQTIIEFTHRMTSGLALLMAVILLLWCWRATSNGNWARYSALLATAFLANEALLGAALVLLGHVARDQSAGRTLFLCLHFGNTLLLLGALALTAAWLQSNSENFTLTKKSADVSAVVIGFLAVLAIGMTGAVAALGDTLFPATSLRASVLQDFTSNNPARWHFRLLHPLLAVIAVTFVICLLLKNSSRRMRQSRASMALILLLFTEIGIGLVNVLLLTPAWVQILHLLVADTIWISLVLASAALVFDDPYTRLGPCISGSDPM